MPSGGANRKPRRAKIIQGTFRKCRDRREFEAPPISMAPKPPGTLNRWGRQEWNRLVPELMRLQVLSELDLTALYLLCEAYGEYEDAKREILHPYDPYLGKRVRRTLAEYLKGRSQQTMPELQQKNRAWALYKSYMTEFGLSPLSRTRIAPPAKVKEPVDPMEDLLR
jgi:P27 family predicted phage terminase small subunit